MANVSIPRIDRKSSIETEPRTLNFRQIDIAREAALYVVLTRTREEACQIFTEGMEEVRGSQKTGNFGEYYSDEEDEDDEEYSLVFGMSRRRSIMKQRSIKDVLTAPF